MIHPRRGYVTGGEVAPGDWVRKTNGYGNRGGTGFMEAATPPRRAFGGFGNHPGGRGIEFGSRPYPEEEMGASSPPLWSRSPPGSASPIHRGFSPNSRLQAIARGQRELMEMVESMPESGYELSLRDMVEVPKSTVNPMLQRGEPPAAAGGPQPEKKKQIKRTKKDARSGYVGNGDFLLRMFMPASLKKSGSGKGRVSPVKSPEGEWWKKRSSALGEAEKSGRTSRSGSTSSSSSSNTSRRHMSGALPGCWFFLHRHKGKPRKHKEGGLA